MKITSLTQRQQSVLYALVERMARNHEINLANAIAADRGAADEVLDRVLYIGRDIKSVIDRYDLKLGLLRSLASVVHKLIAGDDLHVPFYLARKFDVPCCTLHFPGISDEPDDDADIDLDSSPAVGDLRIEFPDMESRQALLTALFDWSHLGLQSSPPKNGVIAKVAAALDLDMAALCADVPG